MKQSHNRTPDGGILALELRKKYSDSPGAALIGVQHGRPRCFSIAEEGDHRRPGEGEPMSLNFSQNNDVVDAILTR